MIGMVYGTGMSQTKTDGSMVLKTPIECDSAIQSLYNPKETSCPGLAYYDQGQPRIVYIHSNILTLFIH